MKGEKIEVEVVANGVEEVTEQMQGLSDALSAFPAQVVIRGCRDCRIEIHPRQVVFLDRSKAEEEKRRRHGSRARGPRSTA